ncbi:MAG TPA: hypothetical protein VL463_15455 [Kofleriaceae bacterium]|nr:hypothetical protein [Kofleriaceae bacterium]
MRCWLLLASLCAACGGHDHGPDARGDAGSFADAPFTGVCDFKETHDADNASVPEATALTVGADTRTICGQVDDGHFAGGLVDDDRYTITVGGAGADLVVRLAASGAGELDELFVEIQNGANGFGYAVYVVDHGVMITHLVAGTYTVVVDARGQADIGATIPYRVAIAPDDPSVRCPRITAAASHVEKDETPASTANDVIYVAQATGETLTPSTTDKPDDSKIVVTADQGYRITGLSANVDVAPPDGDDYHDRDTFLISTGADTNELDLRLDWTGATNDLDFFLFPEVPDGAQPLDLGAGATGNPEELNAIAVAPSSRYWLWIGGYDMSKALPSTYDVSICGTHHAPL